MLLEFEIQNERAFASASLLSLVASNLKEVNERPVRSIGDAGGTRALTSALILGKNGSGKSTLIEAFSYVGKFVKNSAKEGQADEKMPYDPNKLISKLDRKPTKYRVLFSVNASIYEYEISFDSERIYNEVLSIADKSPRFRKMFERSFDKNTEEYTFSFGEALTGPRKVWQESTRPNALFLSTAVQLNSDILKEPFDWLTKFLRSTRVDAEGHTYTTKRCREDQKFRRMVVRFLKSMDVNVDEILFEEEDYDSNFLNKTFTPEFLKQFSEVSSRFLDEKSIKVFFEKAASNGDKVTLPIEEESTGTRALYSLAGPLHDTLENGYCLLIDEINTSLHPLVIQLLVKMFESEKTNPKRAQIIFTSHDVSILRDDFLRRDQVWFIENDGCEAKLVPLSDYSPRRREALERGYLMGRYGGIPSVSLAYLEMSDD